MKYIAYFLLAILTFIYSDCGLDIEQEEANLYRFYINKYFITQTFPDLRFENKPFSLIVIDDRTSGSVVPFVPQSSIDALNPRPEQSTLKSFIDRNNGYYTKEKKIKLAGRFPLAKPMKFDLPHTLVPSSEIDQIFANGKWDEFFRRYPASRGLVFLSRVGFNRKMTQALLYFIQDNGGSMGGGYLILFEKRGIVWKRLAQETVWIS